MPHGARSARADQKTHKKPTTSPGRSLPPRHGEGPPRSTQPGLRGRSRAPGHPRRRQPRDRAGVRHHGLPRAGRPGPVARGLVREQQPAAVRGGVRGTAGRQAGEGHRAAGRRRTEHGADRRRPHRALPRPDRLPADRRWSRKHAHTQRRLCERFAAPVIGTVTCQDITTGHMPKIVNAAPTAGEGARVQGMISALVSPGLDGGYLASPRLAKVHWQAGDRPLPAPRVSVAGSRRCGSTPPRYRPTATSPDRGGGRPGPRASRRPRRAASRPLRHQPSARCCSGA